MLHVHLYPLFCCRRCGLLLPSLNNVINFVVTVWYVVLIMLMLFGCRFAYIEFTDKESVDNAVSLDDSLFKGRQIKVQYPFVVIVETGVHSL